MKEYKRIVLVDDNDTAIFLNKDIVLEIYPDVEILSYTNSQEFIDDSLKMEKSFFESSLILLDINMPGKFGFDVLDEIEEEREDDFDNLDIIMVTSSDLKRDIEVATRFPNIKGYIVKPLTKEKLMEKVN